MTLASERLGEIAAWIKASSAGKRTPLDGETAVGPWAVIVAADFNNPPSPQFDVEALPLWVPTEQAEGVALAPVVTAAPLSQGAVGDRLAHLIWRVEDGSLPPCVIVGLSSPVEPILAAVARAGASDADLTAFPLLGVPLWSLSPVHRAELKYRLPQLR